MLPHLRQEVRLFLYSFFIFVFFPFFIYFRKFLFFPLDGFPAFFFLLDEGCLYNGIKLTIRYRTNGQSAATKNNKLGKKHETKWEVSSHTKHRMLPDTITCSDVTPTSSSVSFQRNIDFSLQSRSHIPPNSSFRKEIEPRQKDDERSLIKNFY